MPDRGGRASQGKDLGAGADRPHEADACDADDQQFTARPISEGRAQQRGDQVEAQDDPEEVQLNINGGVQEVGHHTGHGERLV